MAVAKTTNEVKLAIERKTAKTLPDQPTARGYTAATIKGALYKWLSDPTNSLFAELDRIVDEANAEIADLTDNKSNLAGGNTFTGDQTFTGDVIVEEDIEVDGDIVAKGDITANGYVTGKFGIDANDKLVSRVATPILNTDAPNKKYVDDADALNEKLANKKTSLSDNSDTYYPSQKAVKTAVDARVPLTRTIIGLDLQDDVLLAEFKTAIGNATTELAGLMSATDKSRLDALHGILGEEADVDEVVNTINEILAIFDNYPEGVDLVAALAGKVDKVEGKELSDNNYTDAEAAKVGHLPADFEAFIADYYTKAQVDTLLDQLTTAYGLSETAIDELEDNDTIALADLTTYDYITLVLKHTDTHFIFDGKLIDPASFVNANDVIQLNAFEGGTQHSYGTLTYDGSTNLTFEASDASDTLIIKGYKKDTVTGLLVEETFASTNHLDAETNVHDAFVALDALLIDAVPTGEGQTDGLMTHEVLKAHNDALADIDDIKDGTIIVKKASQDGDGNDIVATYATKTALAVETLRNAEQAKQLADLQEFAQKALANEVSATVDDDGTGIASLGKDVARAPLSVKVEGLLLDSVNKFNLTTTTTNGITATVSGNQITFSGTATEETTFTLASGLTATNKAYVNLDYRSGTSDGVITLYNHETALNAVYGTDYSGVVTLGTTTITLVIADGATLTALIYKVNVNVVTTMQSNNLYSPLYNKGMATMEDSEIKAQMDAWVLDGTLPNSIHPAFFDKRVKAVGKNLFDKGKYATSYAYKIKVKPSTAYVWTASTAYKTYDIDETELVSATGTTVTTGANAHYIAFSGVANVDTFQLELGSTATTYEPFVSSEQYLFGNAEGYSLPNGTKDSVESRNGKAYYIQRGGKRVLESADFKTMVTSYTYVDSVVIELPSNCTTNSLGVGPKLLITDVLFGAVSHLDMDNVSFIGQWGAVSSANRQIAIIVAKGTSLADARTAYVGKVVYYQLATPVETLIEVSGNLQGHPNGTVYIEDATCEVLAYSSGLTTAHDISSIIECVKLNADGTQTVIANSAVTLTSNQVSAITDASAGDIYYIAYYYKGTYCKGLTTVTYYDDRQVVLGTGTAVGKVYKITPTAPDGVLTWVLTEV